MLDKKLLGINNGCTWLIVHKNANPSPPNEKPVTINPKNTILNIFQQCVYANATEPNIHIYNIIDYIGYTIANTIIP